MRKVTESPAALVVIIIPSIQSQYKNRGLWEPSARSHKFVIRITALQRIDRAKLYKRMAVCAHERF